MSPNMQEVVIGVTTDFERMERPSGQKDTAFIYERYYRIFADHGAIPLLLPPLDPEKALYPLKNHLAGIVLSGGDDLPPHLYGQKPLKKKVVEIHPLRTRWEMAVAQFALEESIPLLGICLGAQVINVVSGGNLIQDIPSQRENSIIHKQKKGPAFHSVRIQKESMLYSILEEEEILVNSYHHQGIGQLGSGIRLAAWAEDGIPEAIEKTDHPFALGIQWHLELDLEKQSHSHRIVEAFLETARRRIQEKVEESLS